VAGCVYSVPMDARLLALNRFGLGARPGERQRLSDPRGWLKDQLRGAPPAIEAPAEASAQAIASALRDFRMPTAEDKDARQQARRNLIAIAAAESRAALTARVASDRPFVERLVAFWSNHLCISINAKVLVAPLAGSYEREAIRPHVLGRFEQLVLASAKHPAMLVYLDNFQSIGPRSAAAGFTRRNGQPRGLNENYARELLELHTLGVNGGYTQQDVQELAKILTGWTVSGLRARGFGRWPEQTRGSSSSVVGFAFQERFHEPGARVVLGSRYAEGGVAQGERVIRDLCRHPSTGRFIATKLVRHFVSDEPPAAAVDRVARAFRETGGDLRAVSAAIVDLPEAWSGEHRKFRTPQDWLVASMRAFNVTEVRDSATFALRQLRHPLWGPQAPKGFGDSVQEWADPDALLNRGELARTFARRIGAGRIDPRMVVDVADVSDSDPLRAMMADNSIPAIDRVALALASPAVQWR
jgi:uncharacterized protein (DUF1800 family)